MSSNISVLSIYTKLGGKNGKHCWVGETSSITAVSHMPIQLFKYIISRHFHPVPQFMNYLQVSRFALLSSASFLYILDEAPTILMGSQNLQIS
jgi:hypothetical protein